MELSYFALIGAPKLRQNRFVQRFDRLYAKVANYPGVTVDKRGGAFLTTRTVHYRPAGLIQPTHDQPR